MRVATIDIGTNSVLLLIAESTSDCPGNPTALYEASTITRLGQGVEKTGQLAPEAIHRTLACLKDYGQQLRKHDVDRFDVVSTSASRDAAGTDEFLSEASRILGQRPRVISGQQEATLTFRGALTGLTVEGEVVVFDIGGGSTEVVFGTRSGGAAARVSNAFSLNVGCVRMTERHVASDPPAADQLEAIARDAREAWDTLPQPGGACTLIGIGGTITNLAAVHCQMSSYDAARVHGSVIGSDAISRLRELFASTPVAERRSIVGLEPKRADVITAGAVLVESLLAWARRDTTRVSDRGVRWGLALELGGPTL